MTQGPSIRSITGAGAAILLVVVTVTTVSAASPSPSPVPSPYGPARNGSFAFAQAGDIWVADADGATRVAIDHRPRE